MPSQECIERKWGPSRAPVQGEGEGEGEGECEYVCVWVPVRVSVGVIVADCSVQYAAQLTGPVTPGTRPWG